MISASKLQIVLPLLLRVMVNEKALHHPDFPKVCSVEHKFHGMSLGVTQRKFL